MTGEITDPQAFFKNLTHDLGPKARPEYLAYRPGEVILEESAPVRRMLMVRYGDVVASTGDKMICRYISDHAARGGSLPILSATDYCYSSGSSYTYVAETDVEIMTIDTRILIDMGKRKTNLVLFRNLVLFSDMGVKLRQMIAEEFERTGLMCFSPEVSEEDILRYHPTTFEEFYLDFAMRAMGELTIGRMVRSDHPSTAITALQRPAWMTREKSY
jgi:signal-transduction protein with cAMP-binding, CBS, and nucleotidyltransferase domain